MPLRAFLTLLLVLPVLCLPSGCASIRPDRVTLFVERDEAETAGGQRQQRTATNKVGLSATYDLSPRRP